MNPIHGDEVPYLASSNRWSMLGCLQSNLLYEAIGVWLLLTGTIGFLSMGIDKERAIDGEWRIPERALFVLALVGGSFGIATGSVVFHHKISKLGFLAVLCSILVAWLSLLQQIGFLDCLATYLPR